MNREELASWAAREWMRQAEHNTPLAKSIRNAKAEDRRIKREYLKEKRSLSSRSAAKSRVIRKHQIESEAALRKREMVRDAEMAERLWRLIIDSQ